jgi:tRNA (cytidine32/guanosine34-2'-O)-methyltransferase
MPRFNREKRDLYYRAAKEMGFRARSAYKLLQADDAFHLLGPSVARCVDLCAAPGSWSQVLSQRLVVERVLTGLPPAAIVAVDLQAMAPIEGVACVQGDITSRATAAAITGCFRGAPAQLVVCDGAPDVTGLHDIDEWLQWQLLVSAANIATHTLAPGGAFFAKMFTGANTPLLVATLRTLFHAVEVFKPHASRPGSHEAFVVARGFAPPPEFSPAWDAPALAAGAGAGGGGEGGSAAGAGDGGGGSPPGFPAFFALGDLSGADFPVAAVEKGGGEEAVAARREGALALAEALLGEEKGVSAPLPPPPPL